MLLTTPSLLQLIDDGFVVAPRAAVKSSSIDVTLANPFWKENKDTLRTITLRKGKMHFKVYDLSVHTVALQPNEFALARLAEYVKLPNKLSAVFYLDSTLARCGLEHSAAIFLQPGWDGFLTLELKNISQAHILQFYKDMPIGKIVFFPHDATEGYHGTFQHQVEGLS